MQSLWTGSHIYTSALASYSILGYSSLGLASVSESEGINKKQYETRADKKVVLDERRRYVFWTS